MIKSCEAKVQQEKAAAEETVAQAARHHGAMAAQLLELQFWRGR